MEPGHEDREYKDSMKATTHDLNASMEPGHEDREYQDPGRRRSTAPSASMEPGHEDREYVNRCQHYFIRLRQPQWSPVMKTGNTRLRGRQATPRRRASMEPGHEDREYDFAQVQGVTVGPGLNGARS